MDFQPLPVTVPAPTRAPVLHSLQGFGDEAYQDGVTYEVACTYVGHSGETQLGPAASFHCTPRHPIAVLQPAPLGSPALGFRIYLRPDGGTWRRVTPVWSNPEAVCGFGDEAAWGGVYTVYRPDGVTPPSAGTALDLRGVALAPPTEPPRLTTLSAFPDGSGPWYAAYSYVGADGQETALSPLAGPVTYTGQGHSGRLGVCLWAEPPNGAVFVNLYVGQAPDALRLQLERQPLSAISLEVQAFDPAGRAPQPGQPRSTVSPLQQAYDAVQALGGGEVDARSGGPFRLDCPLILRLQSRAWPAGRGLTIAGSGKDHDHYGPARVIYTGPQSGVEAVVCLTSGLRWSGLSVVDPDRRVRVGLVLADASGGGGFRNLWRDAVFQAHAPVGVGLQIPQHGANGTSHIASEQWFERVDCSGEAWGMDLHGGQTVNLRFRDLTCVSGGNGGSANSGDLRAFGVPVSIDGYNTDGRGHYLFFLTNEPPHPRRGGRSYLGLRNGFSEHVQARTTAFVSGCQHNGGLVNLSDGNLLQNSAGYALLHWGRASYREVGNLAVAGAVL